MQANKHLNVNVFFHRFAFVQFANESAAKDAFQTAQGLQIKGQDVSVTFAFAKAKPA